MMCEFSDYQVLFASYGYSLGTVHCEVGKDVCALNIQKPNLPDIESDFTCRTCRHDCGAGEEVGRRSRVCLLQL